MSVTEISSPISDGHLFEVGAATGGDRVSASGKDGRTPAMRRLFAKRAHCKWHNIAPPERRRIGSTCARVPKVSSRNRGCPFRGYGCGGNPQEGGSIFIIQERGEESPNSGSPINHRRRFIGASGRRGHNTPLSENGIKSGAPAERTQSFRWGLIRGPRRKDAVVSVGFNLGPPPRNL